MPVQTTIYSTHVSSTLYPLCSTLCLISPIQGCLLLLYSTLCCLAQITSLFFISAMDSHRFPAWICSAWLVTFMESLCVVAIVIFLLVIHGRCLRVSL